MAGQAPASSDSRMPISIARVSSAAPLAAQPNRRSAAAPVRGRLAGGGLDVRASALGRQVERAGGSGECG